LMSFHAGRLGRQQKQPEAWAIRGQYFHSGCCNGTSGMRALASQAPESILTMVLWIPGLATSFVAPRNDSQGEPHSLARKASAPHRNPAIFLSGCMLAQSLAAIDAHETPIVCLFLRTRKSAAASTRARSAECPSAQRTSSTPAQNSARDGLPNPTEIIGRARTQPCRC